MIRTGQASHVVIPSPRCMLLYGARAAMQFPPCWAAMSARMPAWVLYVPQVRTTWHLRSRRQMQVPPPQGARVFVVELQLRFIHSASPDAEPRAATEPYPNHLPRDDRRFLGGTWWSDRWIEQERWQAMRQWIVQHSSPNYWTQPPHVDADGQGHIGESGSGSSTDPLPSALPQQTFYPSTCPQASGSSPGPVDRDQ